MRIQTPIALMATLFVTALGVCSAVAQTRQPPLRIETPGALKQVVRRVEPAWTQAMIDANPGAVLAADVIVGVTGTVESVTVIVGPDALRPSLVAALTQWTFAPFSSGGRAVRAVVMVDFQLKNPQHELERKASDDYRALIDNCQHRIETRAADAVDACEAAARASEGLPAERRPERSRAIGMFGGALLVANRPAEALVQFDRALTYRRGQGGADAESGSLLVLVGRAHAALGDLQEADAALTEAVETLRRAIAADPLMKTMHSQMLEEFLREQAELKAVVGKRADAEALAAAANSVGAPARGRPMPPMTRAGNLQLGGTIAPLLSSGDLRQIRALLPTGKTPWLLMGNGDGDSRWYANVFLEPEVVTTTFRRGEVVTLMAAPTPGAGAASSRKWEAPGIADPFVQVPLPERNANEILRTNDLNRPVRVPATAAEPLTDLEVVGVIEFLRSAAARSAGTPNAGDLRESVQRWPIDDLVRWPDGRVNATLHEATTVDGPSQLVTLRREGTTWVIVKLERR